MTTFSPRELIETFIRNYASLFSFFFFPSPFFLTLFQPCPTSSSNSPSSVPCRVCISRIRKMLRHTTIRRFWNNGWHGYAILWNYFVQFTATSTGPWNECTAPTSPSDTRFYCRRSDDLSWLAVAFLPGDVFKCLAITVYSRTIFHRGVLNTASVTRCSFAPSEESRYSFRLNNCLQPRRS